MGFPFIVLCAALLLSGSALSGCSTVLGGSTEDIRIDIAGAGEALCDVTQPGRRYRANAPATFRVMKSDDDLRVRCFANGNREQVMIVKPVVSEHDIYNIANGYVPGAAWDYATGARYDYPDHILMDFSAIPPQPYPLPDYQVVYAEHPELLGMEQFRPGKSALGSDVGHYLRPLQTRDGSSDGYSEIMMPVQGSGGTTSSSFTSSASVSQPAVAAPTQLAPLSTAPPANGPATGAATTKPSLFKNGTAGSSSSSSKIFTNKIGTVPGSTTGSSASGQ